MASSGDDASRASSADSSRAIAGGSTRPTSVESDANLSATVSLVRPGLSLGIDYWIALAKREQERQDFFKFSEPLERSLLPRTSPWGPIGAPPPPPTSRLNPRAKKFKPKRAKPSAPTGPPEPGSDILELYLLRQFPPYEVRRDMHNSNHPQWSRMLAQVQRANPNAVGAIQQFAELEKQRYKGML